MAKDKTTDEGLITRIRSEVTGSLGYMGDTISQQREKAMQYYYGLPFGNEIEGRSQYVDSTVQDTIEWIKPSSIELDPLLFPNAGGLVKCSRRKLHPRLRY